MRRREERSTSSKQIFVAEEVEAEASLTGLALSRLERRKILLINISDRLASVLKEKREKERERESWENYQYKKHTVVPR